MSGPDIPVCLSAWQPWAWLIVQGFKPIENRSWRTWRRGRVLIHASKKVDRAAMAAVQADRHPVTGKPMAFGAPAVFETGGIVGEAAIVNCVSESDSDWFVGPYGFVLRSPRPLPFTPCRGALGIFKLPGGLIL
ncbi:ASCH domain-containing protein [Amorphus sp. 3PC139-8]|uniref:ASCH domain-containing protein n=1 Tax=Amorphus sp. 3PC139-8 TaxID=2735676 RepID=UPI00345CF56C